MQKVEYKKQVAVNGEVIENEVSSVVYRNITLKQRDEITEKLQEYDYSYDGFFGNFSIGIINDDSDLENGYHIASDEPGCIRIMEYYFDK